MPADTASPTTVPDAVWRHAPEAAEHLATAQRTAASVVDVGLVELARLRIDHLLGVGAAASDGAPTSFDFDETGAPVRFSTDAGEASAPV